MTRADAPVVPKPKEREAFYAAAVAGLRALDARERAPRRFGADADTRWASFKGALTEADRIDFLLRDAAVTWGAAFSPAESFGLFGLAPDEPFGPDWQPLGSSAARRYLDDKGDAAGLDDLGKLLGIESQKVTVPAVTASTRLAVAGGTVPGGSEACEHAAQRRRRTRAQSLRADGPPARQLPEVQGVPDRASRSRVAGADPRHGQVELVRGEAAPWC